jgi:hypothetical protein
MTRTDKARAYSLKEWPRAVHLSVAFGWGAVLTPTLFQKGWLDIHFPSVVFVLPVALFVVWICVAPVLYWRLQKPVSYIHAGAWGGGFIASIILLYIACQLSLTSGFFHKSTSFYRVGVDIAIFVKDGVLTAFDWPLIIHNNALFVVKGVCTALLVCKLIGQGDYKNEPA